MLDICVRDLNFKRGDFSLAVDGIKISPGEKVAIMGENGCGKSTLLSLMTGLLHPPKKTVSFGDRAIEKIGHGERSRLFSVLPQFSEVVFPFSVFEVVLFGRYAKLTQRDFTEEDKRLTEEMLERLDIAHLKERKFGELSGGEKRRVMIARVLNQDAPIVFLDEPNSSLDVRHTLDIFSIFAELDRTVVAVVHDVNLAHRYFDRFIFLKKGRLLRDTDQASVDEALLSEVYDVSVSTGTRTFVFDR